MDHKKSDEDRFKRTRALIQQFGLQVILIPASEYLPSFAYSIGLWQTYHDDPSLNELFTLEYGEASSQRPNTPITMRVAGLHQPAD